MPGRKKNGRFLLISLLLAVIAAFALPLPAAADGGPVAGPGVWQLLKEGQQIAIVSLDEDGTADIDLFVSLLDTSGESHEITYFVPLGYDVSGFNVNERDGWDFQNDNTRQLDERLVREARLRRGTLEALFGGTLLVNGIWLLPVWGPLLLSGCGGEAPLATYETESSTVNIFGLDDDTDLEDLIATAGLDISVTNTLERLRGQRIAVVTLQTQPVGGAGDGTEEPYDYGQPGLLLTWTTALEDTEDGLTYAYPLGTGESWFHPIEQTRVYVTAPPSLDVSITYPELGAEHSGFKRNGLPRITDYYDQPAYAVEDATDEKGYVWRATYLESNAAEDIIITATPSSGSSIIGAALHRLDGSLLFLYSFIIALALWLLGWRFLMPRLLGEGYRGSGRTLLKYALTYTGVNILLMIPGGFLYLVWSFTGNFLTLLLLFAVFGGGAVCLFGMKHVKHLGPGDNKAAKAFFIVSLASNGVYLLLALAYLQVAGFI